MAYLEQSADAGNPYSYRTISLGDGAMAILAAQEKKHGDACIFPSPNGGPISPDSVQNMLNRVLKRAGLPKIRVHDLRHTFATLALQNGVDIKTVSGMLGHYSAGFTLAGLQVQKLGCYRQRRGGKVEIQSISYLKYRE